MHGRPLKSKRRFPWLFAIIVVILVLIIALFSFLAWRTYTLRRISTIYYSNHDLALNVSNEYAEYVDVFNSLESRIPESDFSTILSVHQDNLSALEDSRGSLQRHNNLIITDQIPRINTIFNEISEVYKMSGEYAEYIRCASVVTTSLNQASEDVQNQQLTVRIDNQQQPNIEDIATVRDYLRGQSEINLGYLACFNENSLLNLIQGTAEVFDIINTYSEELSRTADLVDQLIQQIQNQEYDAASETSSQIVSYQSGLSDLAPEANIYVASEQIDSQINTVAELFREYNLEHRRVESRLGN